MKTTKSIAQSTTVKLSQLAKNQGKPFDKLLTIFLLERAIVRMMTDTKLHDHLIFKGGYVSVRVYDSPRFTIDIDTILRGLSQEEAIEKIKIAMAQPSADATWFQFEKEVNLVMQNEYGGRRLIYRGGLGEMPAQLNRAQIIDIDIGTNDPVTPAPISIQSPTLLDSGSISWQVYPVETILAEKIHALVSKGSANSRAKDVFDIGLLLPKASPVTLQKAIQATFSYRGDPPPADIGSFLTSIDLTLLKKAGKVQQAMSRRALILILPMKKLSRF